MAQIVYLLCTITSLFCAGLLYRSYRKTGTSLLLWSLLCFVCLSVNNILLFVDFLAGPGFDFSIWRSSFALAGIGVLLYGLIWDTV